MLVGQVQHRRLGAVLDSVGALAQLERQDVLAVDGLADGDDLGEVGVFLAGPEDLLLEIALAAVRAEHTLGRVLHAVLGLGRDPVLGKADALLLELLGVLVGEVDLDGGRALVWHSHHRFRGHPVRRPLQSRGYLLLLEPFPSWRRGIPGSRRSATQRATESYAISTSRIGTSPVDVRVEVVAHAWLSRCAGQNVAGDQAKDGKTPVPPPERATALVL
ncbi:hypothetical protein [Streptomyces sp. HG99]|uniref:hypothetical protein n=1 Tax=Streptomyces sp. HG99 TaxID=1958787 RepID=UPI0035A0DE92